MKLGEKKIMNFKEYEERAMACMRPDLPLTCKVLGLVGEAGEVAELFKKMHRGDYTESSVKFQTNLPKELGDTMWYILALAKHYDIPMEEIFLANVNKLEGRVVNNTIQGDGDER